MIDFTAPQTVWIVAAAKMGPLHIALSQRMLAVFGREQNHTNSIFIKPYL